MGIAGPEWSGKNNISETVLVPEVFRTDGK